MYTYDKTIYNYYYNDYIFTVKINNTCINTFSSPNVRLIAIAFRKSISGLWCRSLKTLVMAFSFLMLWSFDQMSSLFRARLRLDEVNW